MSDGDANANVLDLSPLLKPSTTTTDEAKLPSNDHRRRELGVSRAVLAAEAGCSPSAILNFERGGNVRAATRAKIEAALAELTRSPRRPPQRKMSVAEAGRRGGMANLRANGRDFFARIGQKGGRRLAALLEAGRIALAADEDATDAPPAKRALSKVK